MEKENVTLKGGLLDQWNASTIQELDHLLSSNDTVSGSSEWMSVLYVVLCKNLPSWNHCS